MTRADRLAVAVVLVAVAAAYANAIGAAFQFDDWNVIVDEPRVASLAAWWGSMPGIRPLLKLTYAFGNASGMGAPGFHAVNVAIHAANAALVFFLARRLAPAGRFVPALTALLFALHPVQTEAVTYVSGRSTSLCFLFALAGVVSWLEAGERRWIRLALSPALFVVALGVKELAVVVPFAIAIAARAAFGRWPRPRELAPHLAVLALAAAAVLSSPVYRHLLTVSLGTRGVADNLRAQAVGIPWLVAQLFRPDLLNADPGLAVPTTWTLPLVASAAAIAAILVTAIVAWPRLPSLAFALTWCALWLAPTNSLLARLDVANDRQLYAPLVGAAWLVALGVARLPSWWRVGLAGALCAGLLVATVDRNRVYRDEIAFWADVAWKSPRNVRAWNNLGYALALEGRDEEAATAFEEALGISPADPEATMNLHLLRRGRLGPTARPRRGACRSPRGGSRRPSCPTRRSAPGAPRRRRRRRSLHDAPCRPA